MIITCQRLPKEYDENETSNGLKLNFHSLPRGVLLLRYVTTVGHSINRHNMTSREIVLYVN